MKTTLTLLAVGTALVLPVAASAQSPADIAYCKKLAMLWYTYFDTDPSTSVATALNTCHSASAIVAAWARRKVDGRDNGHTAKCYGNPLGVECEACKRRAPVALDRLGTLDGNVRPPRDWPLKCCGGPP